jgi:N utilization substance protein B
MSTPRDIRRCAIQALYQLDAQREGTAPSKEALLASLGESPGNSDTHKDGLALALEAWASRTAADHACASLAPDWPTHRQPMIDRCILRLAHFEIASGRTPPKVAINEAIELAREFSTEKSPAFINGILDKILKQVNKRNTDASPANTTASEEADAAQC